MGGAGPHRLRHVIELLNTPTAAIDTDALRFADTAVGSAAPAQTMMLVNTGVRPLTFQSAAVTGAHATDFAVSASGCAGVALDILDSCPLQVRFSPMGAGARNAQPGVSTDDPAGLATVTLTGIGTAATGAEASGGGSQVPPAPAPTVPPDRTAPKLKLTVPKVRVSAKLRGLPVKVACSEACLIDATLTVRFTQPLVKALRMPIALTSPCGSRAVTATATRGG